MSYERVLPRDLFNESKLLKGLGQISLLIHDETVRWPLTIEHTHADQGFVVRQNQSDGSIYCLNVTVRAWGVALNISSALNDKAPYTLTFYDDVLDEDGDMPVFNDDGSFADEFEAFLDKLAGRKPDGVQTHEV